MSTRAVFEFPRSQRAEAACSQLLQPAFWLKYKSSTTFFSVEHGIHFPNRPNDLFQMQLYLVIAVCEQQSQDKLIG